MEFLGIGLGEILLILVVALVIFGPGRIVEIGKTLGKTVRTFKKMTSDLTAQITNETVEQEKERLPQPHRGSQSLEKRGISQK